MAGRVRRRAVAVDLRRLDLPTDDNGLPMHGTMAAGGAGR
jgi:hypothetical protein